MSAVVRSDARSVFVSWPVDRERVGERSAELKTSLRERESRTSRRGRLLVGAAPAIEEAFEHLERALEQRVEVITRLQKRRGPEIDLFGQPLNLGFDGACRHIIHLNVAIPFVEHREADE